jgi:ubiquinone/menaquinone biosynthesis C-methylase UbiE
MINNAVRNAIHRVLEVPAMARLLGIPGGKRALLVGCGSGVALSSLAKLCHPNTVIGIDIDGDLLMAAAERMETEEVAGELVKADVQAMPFPEGAFDLILDFGTCYHTAHPQRALQEVARVLDTGGIFAYETPAAQMLAHPRGFTRRLPWEAEASLVAGSAALLWAVRTKV